MRKMTKAKAIARPSSHVDRFASELLLRSELVKNVALQTLRKMKANGMNVRQLPQKRTYLKRARRNIANKKI